MQTLILVLLAVAVIGTATLAILFFRLRGQHHTLRNEYEELGRQHKSLAAEHDALKQDHAALQKDIDVVASIDQQSQRIRIGQSEPSQQSDAQLAIIQQRAKQNATAPRTAGQNEIPNDDKFPAERPEIMREINNILAHLRTHPRITREGFDPLDPAPGYEIIDFIERACVALGATKSTGRRVHISEVCLEALQNGEWVTFSLRAENAVDVMVSAIRPPKHSDRVISQNRTVILTGDEARFPDMQIVRL